MTEWYTSDKHAAVDSDKNCNRVALVQSVPIKQPLNSIRLLSRHTNEKIQTRTSLSLTIQWNSLDKSGGIRNRETIRWHQSIRRSTIIRNEDTLVSSDSLHHLTLALVAWIQWKTINLNAWISLLFKYEMPPKDCLSSFRRFRQAEAINYLDTLSGMLLEEVTRFDTRSDVNAFEWRQAPAINCYLSFGSLGEIQS